MKLDHYWRSSCSWRVRWALNLKGLSYESIPVNLLLGEQKTPQYLAKNPAGFVPTLEVDGIKLTESCAIIEWLEETHPAPALLPKDPLARAQVRQLAYTVAMGIQPIQNLRVQKYVSDEQAGRKKFAAHWIRTGFKVYEKLLARGNPGAFSFGDEVTLADLCLIPQVYNANRFEVDMGEFPLISGINGRALDTEPCQRAAPENQPGAND